MSTSKPIVNTSQPGVPSASLAIIGRTTSKRYVPYSNYNFPNMFREQTAKLSNGLLRFSLTCGTFVFQAHLDPNHLIDEQGKRIVQLDVLTGIVLQDFGYTAQNIELRGTTGAQYYTEINTMDNVFNNQSTSGIPTPCTLVIESRTYTGVWKDFRFERMSQENTYKYVIGFTVMKSGKSYDTTTPYYASSIALGQTIESTIESTDGKLLVMFVPNAGKTPTDYVNGSPNISTSQKAQALAYLSQHWFTAPDFNKRSYPGDLGKMKAGEVLVVPLNWATVLK